MNSFPSVYDKYILNQNILDELCTDKQSDSINGCKKEFSFKKGDILFKEGEPVENLIFIQKGSVKLYHNPNDKIFIIRIARSGDILGYREIIAGSTNTVTAEAIEAGKGSMVPKKVFNDVIDENPEVIERMLKLMAEEASKTESRMSNLAYKPVKSRVAETLIELQNYYEHQPNKKIKGIKITRENLAGLTGTVRETVIRTLNELQKEQLIDMEDRTIIVKDKDRLKKLAEV